jgi:hypothetical protein
MLAARRGKKHVLLQGVAHQAARRVFSCVKNCLMLRELAASVLPALEIILFVGGFELKSR